MSNCMADPRVEEKTRRSTMATSTGGYCYSDHQNINTTHLQAFDPNPEIYNLTSGMEMMIGFPPKHEQNNAVSFFTRPSANQYNYNQHDLAAAISNEGFMASSSSNNWNNNLHNDQDDQSFRSCVFPCEGNERPSQGLSLSLNSSNNHSSIGLQTFQLRNNDELRFGPSSSRVEMQGEFLIRNSKYLGPAQELLYECCNLGTKHDDDFNSKMNNQKNTSTELEIDENDVRKHLLHSLDFLELQKRKTRLLQMLEEVDRRYKHYCNQMKSVVQSFEAVAGDGAAMVYSAMASRAMSRHFRCLRDGIVKQIKATKKAMGDKDTAAPGTNKGETPRLRLLDQTLRQQRALQQMSMMETHPWRPQRGLPERSVSVLRAWLFEHFLHPYPSDVDKHILARQTGLSRSQVSNWFINARVRLWKPMVEEMYLEELKEQEGGGCADETGGPQNDQSRSLAEDKKPSHDQLVVGIDSESLSSIINTTDNNNKKNKGALLNESNHNFGDASSYGGAMELDFSSYGRGGVSLTLGLHQHGGNNGVSLAFSPSQGSSSLFYTTRDDDHHHNHHHHQMDQDCQTGHYTFLDGDQSQNLPYRNLMGAQLLHDLAG